MRFLKKNYYLFLVLPAILISSNSFAKTKTVSTACMLANQADSYVLAVSWQPAFCESKSDKPECKINDPKVYQASHFTLHGLWPNKTECATNYGFCGEQKTQPASFCDYPAVSLSKPVEEKLAVVMPSVAVGSCLERHEWYKHGTCQKESADAYYAQAVAFAQQFNDSGISQFMADNIGKQVSLKSFLAVLNNSLGAGASNHAKLGCKNGMLVDIYLNLPAQLPANAHLKNLLPNAPKAVFDKSCNKGFRIDAIGQ
ncbi:MAG: hypothetical protein WAX77_04275 [Methylococcaceae bacterium]